MELKAVISFCFFIVATCDDVHHPKVYEEQDEFDKTENIRVARNSETPYRATHQPPIFKFQSAKQQDYLKYRYAQQQKANAFMITNGMTKSHKFRLQPHGRYPKTVQETINNEDVWQPFDPRVPEGTESGKQYKLSLTKNDNTAGSHDLVSEASEIDEQKQDLKRSDSASENNNVIYVHPNQLQEHQKLSLVNPTINNIKKPDTHLIALNDLIGKNPNVQLEGLKRLLQDSPPNNYALPAGSVPELFHHRQHTPIIGNNVNTPNLQGRPTVRINPDNTITLQTSQIIDKGSLEDIQKQLDETSKLQTQQVLARAQEEARAQVEAQHKAIALAQIKAQKEALENIQNSIYGNAQALPLVQNTHDGEYRPIANTLPHIQPQGPPPPSTIPENHEASLTTNNNDIQNSRNVVQYPSNNAVQNDIHFQGDHVANALPYTNTPVKLYENIPAQTYGSKEVLYYAPNHDHQNAAQFQVENNVRVHDPKNYPSVIRQILKTEQVSSENEDASSLHSIVNPKPEATAYQHVYLDSKDVENSGAEQKDYDDLDDYAAKYAFGYRIKDAKEGNDFGHEERRNGKSLEGSYHVLLPDGRVQKVAYYADNSGYHAKVTYEHLSQK